MNVIGKFISDVEKLKKYDRQNNGYEPDYDRFAKDLRKLFERSTSCPGLLPGAVFEYWENEYVFNSQNRKEEPSAENAAKLGAFLSFLESSDEDQELITENDWKELGDMVSYESEDLPINTLQSLMMILVSKGAY